MLDNLLVLLHRSPTQACAQPTMYFPFIVEWTSVLFERQCVCLLSRSIYEHQQMLVNREVCVPYAAPQCCEQQQCNPARLQRCCVPETASVQFHSGKQMSMKAEGKLLALSFRFTQKKCQRKTNFLKLIRIVWWYEGQDRFQAWGLSCQNTAAVSPQS